jgi:hypothetical protein
MSSQPLVIRFMTWIMIACSRVDVTRIRRNILLEFTLKMEALWSSRMVVTTYQIRLCYDPKAHNMNYRCENFGTHVFVNRRCVRRQYL